MNTVTQAQHTPRDDKGRYAHIWGWQGFDVQGREWHMCDHCSIWRHSRPSGSWGRATEAPELRASPEAWAGDAS